MGIAYVVVRRSYSSMTLSPGHSPDPFLPSPLWRDGQDGDIFHCAVAVLLHHLEHIDTYLCLCELFHDSTPSCRVHSDLLAIK